MRTPACPECEKPMTLIHRAVSSGSDGRVHTATFRCSPCWTHETVEEKRDPLGAQKGTVNL